MLQPTVKVRLRNLMESLEEGWTKAELREVLRDIYLDAEDLEDEVMHLQDHVKELEVELAWRGHDERPTSGIGESGVIHDAKQSDLFDGDTA